MVATAIGGDGWGTGIGAGGGAEIGVDGMDSGIGVGDGEIVSDR